MPNRVHHDVNGMISSITPMSRFRQCTCGSGHAGEEQFDARGIYLCITCDKCHNKKMARYRPEVLTDFNYEADEPVEPEE